MKHFPHCIIALLLLIAGLSPVSAQLTRPGPMSNFRKSPWGATMRQVKKAEHLKLLHEDSADLFYSGKVSGISADVTYKFYKAKLYLGQIDFMEGHDGTAAIADFSQIKAAIESVYGNTDSKLHWTNAALEYSASDHVDQWGEAVEQGYLSMDCTWSAGPAVSELSLSGGDDGIHLHFISQNQTLAPVRPSAEGEF